MSFLSINKNSEKQVFKRDLIELSNIKYELANIDIWKKIIQDLLVKKINEFELNKQQDRFIRTKLNILFNESIDKAELKYKKDHYGITIFADLFGVFNRIKDEIPGAIDSAVLELNSGETKKKLKDLLINKIDEIVDNTFAKVDYTIHNNIINTYRGKDRINTVSLLKNIVKHSEADLKNYKYGIALTSILLMGFMLFSKSLNKLDLIILVSIISLLLLMGLILPMIEIDARISEIRFEILGETVSFTNQVLYYKSKSIIEVVKLMITQGGFDLLIVGLFIFLFSVVFPISKLISSLLLILKPHLKNNKTINFLVNKTGKWSMADVMVVSIFMAYIGFSGILTEQLGQIENMSTKIDILTTNKSSLQTGFIAFFCFSILSILTATKLTSSFIED